MSTFKNGEMIIKRGIRIKIKLIILELLII